MTAARGTAARVDSELDRYMQETTYVVTDSGLLFWQERVHLPAPGTIERGFHLGACLSSICWESLLSLLGTSCFLKMNRTSAYPWTDMCDRCCCELSYIVIIGAFDFLTAYGFIVAAGFFDHSNNCMCNFNCNWKTITGITLPSVTMKPSCELSSHSDTFK